MNVVADSGPLKFFLGFVGILTFGFVVLVAVGFYQTEFGGDQNVLNVRIGGQI
jgi:hypothetical protein